MVGKTMNIFVWADRAENLMHDILAPLPADVVTRRQRQRSALLGGALAYLGAAFVPIFLIR